MDHSELKRLRERYAETPGELSTKSIIRDLLDEVERLRNVLEEILDYDQCSGGCNSHRGYDCSCPLAMAKEALTTETKT